MQSQSVRSGLHRNKPARATFETTSCSVAYELIEEPSKPELRDNYNYYDLKHFGLVYTITHTRSTGPRL